MHKLDGSGERELDTQGCWSPAIGGIVPFCSVLRGTWVDPWTVLLPPECVDPPRFEAQNWVMTQFQRDASLFGHLQADLRLLGRDVVASHVPPQDVSDARAHEEEQPETHFTCEPCERLPKLYPFSIEPRECLYCVEKFDVAAAPFCCSHVMHKSCCDALFCGNRQPVCPMCRAPLKPRSAHKFEYFENRRERQRQLRGGGDVSQPVQRAQLEQQPRALSRLFPRTEVHEEAAIDCDDAHSPRARDLHDVGAMVPSA
tara:strand:+ start:11819 stop:12589 length:771 start_codon:yes stop_codon:yes gene_type:complete